MPELVSSVLLCGLSHTSYVSIGDMYKDNSHLIIIEDAYFYKVLSRMRNDTALRGELIRIGDAFGIKRPQHLDSSDSVAKRSDFKETLDECSSAIQSVLEGKVPRHDG